MHSSIPDIKPFYVYTNRNNLYIKNINEHTEKLANNVHTYCANIDDSRRIHICFIDIHGKLIHLTNEHSHWKKKIICSVFSNIKNIKNMRLYIINNFLNLFIIEESPISENLFRVSHFNFSPSNYKVFKYHINNIVKDKESIYKLNIDELSNIVLEYKSSPNSSRGYKNNIMVFNTLSRTWVVPNTLLRSSNSDIFFNIKDDLFEYCYSLIYKI